MAYPREVSQEAGGFTGQSTNNEQYCPHQNESELLKHCLSSPSLARVPVYLGLSIPLLIRLPSHSLKHSMGAEAQTRNVLAPHPYPEDQRTSRWDLPN